jgi:hypothetical protein
MENCPFCELIIKDQIISKGNHCCVLKWGRHKVAVLSTHDDAAAEAIAEACKLLSFDQGNYLLKEVDGVAGHWGVRAIPAGEISTIGKSVTRES